MFGTLTSPKNSKRVFKPMALAAAVGLATVMALAAAPAAKADSVQFGVTLGDGGGYGWGGGYRGWGGPGPWHPHSRPHYWGGGYDDGYDYPPPPPPPPPMRWGLSCGAAANVVRNAGFQGVRPTDCSRPVYQYDAWKRGRMYNVDVSISGRIVAIDPIY